MFRSSLDESLEDRKRVYEDRHKKNNPCFKEHDMSLKCLDENMYIREKCQDYFDNYKKCQEFWNKIIQTRKRRGIKPHIPDFEDREAIKKQFRSGIM